MNGEYNCSLETAIKLAGLQIQAKYGRYRERKHKSGYLSGENFIPESILLQNGKSRSNIEDSVVKKHEENGAMPREEAIIEYLKLAQESDMYGITYFGKNLYFAIK